MERSASG
jgi:hypothetical protein